MRVIMKKRFFSIALVVVFSMAIGGSVYAGDLGEQCLSNDYRSPLVEYPRPDLDSQIDKRYQQAVETSQSEPVTYNRDPLFTWANATKVSCGKVKGYLASNEVNVEQITQCDCFYGIMFYLATR